MMIMLMMMMMMMIHIIFMVMIFIIIATGADTTTDTTATTTGDDEYHHHRHYNHHHHHHQYFEKLLCPSSSIIDFNIDGYFHYPIDLFYPKYLDSLLSNINNHQINFKSIDDNQTYSYRHHNHNYSHNSKMKNHQIYHHNSSFMKNNSNIDEILQYIHDYSDMTSKHNYNHIYDENHRYDYVDEIEDDDQYYNEVYNCSKPNYDMNIKYNPHSHHICITNRLFKCPINIHDIIEATSFIINQHDHHHHKDQHHHLDHDNDSNQHEHDTQDDHLKQPLQTLHNLYDPRLCKIHDKLMNTTSFSSTAADSRKDNDGVNVIIIGGSGAEGANSFGCYCLIENDKRCARFDFLLKRPRVFEDCRWGTHFSRWLQQKKALNKVNIIYLTYGGTNSEYMSEVIIQKLMKRYVVLKDTDLVFIDYSMNDAAFTNGQLDSGYKIELGLERLIRKIIEYSWVSSTNYDDHNSYSSRKYDHNSKKLYHNHINTNINDKDRNDSIVNESYEHIESNNDSNRDDGYYNIPYIIILESWPYALGNTNIDPITSSSSSLNIIDYSDCYRKIVKYYNISLWSFRSILWSKRHKTHGQNEKLSNNPAYNSHNHYNANNNDDDDDDTDDSNYIKEQLKYNWDHPFWYHHLYFSDLYSSILEIYFSNCYQMNDFNNNNLSRHDYYKNDKITNYTSYQSDKNYNINLLDHDSHDYQDNHNNYHNYNYYDNDYQQQLKKVTKMPLMITKYNHSYVCNEKIPYTLDIYADKYFNFNNYNNSIIISSVVVSSSSNNNDDRNDNIIRSSVNNNNNDTNYIRNHSNKAAWMMYADKPNKYGFIDILEYNNNNNNNIYDDINDNNHYDKNNYSYNQRYSGSFNQTYDQYHHYHEQQQQKHENNDKPLKINSMKFHFNPIQNDSILMIEYLKTYKNAGLFDLIIVCNHHNHHNNKKKNNNRIYTTIDTLWKDYKTNLYSSNELYILNLSSKYYYNCNGIIIQHNINYCNNDNNNNKKKHNMNLYDDKQHECYARTRQQKVKIMSVKICTQNNIID